MDTEKITQNSDDEKICEQCTPVSIQKIQAEPITKPLSWLKCDKCTLWIHAICDDLSEDDIKIISVYYCKQCRNEGHIIVRQENMSVKSSNSDNGSKKQSEKTKNNADKSDDKSNTDDIDEDTIPNSQPEIVSTKCSQLSAKTNEKAKSNIFNAKNDQILSSP